MSVGRATVYGRLALATVAVPDMSAKPLCSVILNWGAYDGINDRFL